MVREQAIAVCLVAVLVHLTTCDYTGLSFQLSRLNNDKFVNPTATGWCGWQDQNQKFCKDANSRCDKNCCKCTCDYQKSTFDRSLMKCRENDKIRNGCKVKFNGKYDGHQIQLLNLKQKDQIKVNWFVPFSTDNVTSFKIMNITSYHNKTDIKTKFLTELGTPSNPHGRKWETTVQWDKVSTDYYGKLFRVNVSYEFERTLKGKTYQLSESDCFVFKSEGKITVTFPSQSTVSPTKESRISLWSSTLSSTTGTDFATASKPSTMKPSTKSTQSLTTKRPSAEKTKPPRNTTPSKKTTPASYKPTPKATTDEGEAPSSISETSTPTVSMTTPVKESEGTRARTEATVTTVQPPKNDPTLAARSGDSGNNAITIPLAVVGCLVLLIVVALAVLWSRRRSAKSSKEKGGGAVNGNRGVNNPVMMSPLEGIYAEAENPVNYGEKGKNNVCDYAEGNLENDYTSLDMSKVENKPTYQSLINVQSNLYEQIPAHGNVKSSSASDVKGQAPIAEPFYHTVKNPEKGQECGEILGRMGKEDADNVHSVLENKSAPENCDGEVSRRTCNDSSERVYSILEDEDAELEYLKILPEQSAPKNCDGEVSERTCNDNSERVYSILEDEDAELNYLKILPEQSDYEEPFHPPVGDA